MWLEYPQTFSSLGSDFFFFFFLRPTEVDDWSRAARWLVLLKHLPLQQGSPLLHCTVSQVNLQYLKILGFPPTAQKQGIMV